MPFGKFRGQRVCDLPSDYLQWVLGNCANMNPGLRLDVRAELLGRGYLDPAEEVSAAAGPALTVGLLKRWHREMVLKYHPDRGGSNEAMAAINDGHKRLRQMVREQGGP
jgi:hypothetical protein